MDGPRSLRSTSLLLRLGRHLRGVFASDCVFCGLGAGTPHVCPECRTDFLAPRTRCERCAAPLRTAASPATCGACLQHGPHFDATVVAGDYAAPLDALVLALKFGHRLELAPVLGALLAERAALHTPAPARLVAVPLSFERMAERGFNQSIEIAHSLAGALQVALDRTLVLRIRHTPAQAALHLDARRRNIRAAFALRHRVDGQHIGVVDDVMTTGSTLDELAHTLKRAGAARVTNYVFARTP